MLAIPIGDLTEIIQTLMRDGDNAQLEYHYERDCHCKFCEGERKK